VPVQDSLKRTPGDPYQHGVAEAIVLALDAVASGDQTGFCLGLINAVALLSTAGVSRALLYAAGQQGLLQQPGTQTPAAPQGIDEALGRLASASLLTFSVDDATVAAHRLTMRVAREREAQDGSLGTLGAGIAELLSVVTKSLAEPWQNRAAARDAIQQIIALHEHLAPYLGEQDAALTETLLQLRGWAIWCLNDLGDSFAQAIEYGQDLLADREQVLGEAHPSTLTSRNNLAAAYRDAGRVGEAIPLFERTLADRERVLGETHPDTLTSRNNLAGAYQDAGRVDDAEGLRNRADPNHD
jgi:tetratricopeptide (TPR) repeat protein